MSDLLRGTRIPGDKHLQNVIHMKLKRPFIPFCRPLALSLPVSLSLSIFVTRSLVCHLSVPLEHVIFVWTSCVHAAHASCILSCLSHLFFYLPPRVGTFSLFAFRAPFFFAALLSSSANVSNASTHTQPLDTGMN